MTTGPLDWADAMSAEDNTLLDFDGVADAVAIMRMSIAELKQFVGKRVANWPDMWIAAARGQQNLSQKEWLQSIALKFVRQPCAEFGAPSQPVPSVLPVARPLLNLAVSPPLLPTAVAQPLLLQPAAIAPPLPPVPVAAPLPSVAVAPPLPPVTVAPPLPSLAVAPPTSPAAITEPGSLMGITPPLQLQLNESQLLLPQPRPSAVVRGVFRYGQWWLPSSLPPSPPVTPALETSRKTIQAAAAVVAAHAYQSYVLRCSLLVFAAAVAIGTPMSAPIHLGAPILGISALLPVSFSSLRVWIRVVPLLLTAAVIMQLQFADAPTARSLHNHFVSGRVTFTRTLVLSAFGCLWSYAPLHDRRLERSCLLGFWVLGGTGCAILLSLGPPDSLSRRTVLLAVASSIIPFPAMYVALSRCLRGR